jgi:hypothetical protein
MTTTPGSQRKAEHDERKRLGLIMLKRVVCDETNLTAVLVATGHLDPNRADDPAAIDRATGKLLDSLGVPDASGNALRRALFARGSNQT